MKFTPPHLAKVAVISLFSLMSVYIKAQTTFTATNVKVMDTLTSNNVIKANEIVATETITAKNDIVAEQDVKINGVLTVTNTANFKGIVDLGNGVGFKSFPATNGHPTIFKFGTSVSLQPNNNGQDPEDIVTCANPILGGNPLFSFVGNLKASSYLPNSTGSTILGHDGANGIIDVQGTASNYGAGSLLVNYYCKRNVSICTNGNATNPNENHIYMGEFVSAAKHFEIGNNSTGIGDAGNTALQINAWNGNGLLVNCFNSGNLPSFITKKNNTITSTIFGDGMFWQNTTLTGLKMLRVYDATSTGNQQDKFVVMGDGKTFIGIGRPKVGGLAQNAMFTVDGMILAKEVYIATSNNFWADYVFKKDYKLLEIDKLKNYIEINKHLPNIPNADKIEKDGLPLAEMQKLQMEKIEELYLYIIKLNDEIKELKAKNQTLLESEK